jgi:hypothetical protein
VVIARLAALLACALGLAGPAPAATLAELGRQSSTDHCAAHDRLTARQQARLLQFADIARRELEATGHPLALVSRSGLDLRRFGQRYSHAGVGLRDAGGLPWAVRQLYYACDERRPRLFDQGLSGFVMGTDDPDTGFLSVVLLPQGTARDALLAAASDTSRALALLGARYSPSAYAFGTAYQNCNQWLAELLGAAWMPAGTPAATREAAQQRLRELGYQPAAIAVPSRWLLWAARAVPLIRLDDHPAQDQAAARLQVSLPSSIEAFVRAVAPQAERLEMCHAAGRVVIRRGWQPLADGCEPGPGDRVVELGG